jgi:hypothetical protein
MGQSAPTSARDIVIDEPIALRSVLAVERGPDEFNPDWLETGDLVLFSGTGWRARLIELFTHCAYSHVGMIYRLPETHDGNPASSELYLLESVGHADELYCVLHGKRKGGVRLVELRERLRQYMRESGTGTVRVCVVKAMIAPNPHYAGPGTLYATSRGDMSERLGEFVSDVCDSRYGGSAARLVRHSYPALFGGGAGYGRGTAPLLGLDQYTCTELVAAALVHMQLASPELPIEQIQLPRHFMSGALDPHHYWLCGYLSPYNVHMTVSDRPRPPAAHPMATPPPRRHSIL